MAHDNNGKWNSGVSDNKLDCRLYNDKYCLNQINIKPTSSDVPNAKCTHIGANIFLKTEKNSWNIPEDYCVNYNDEWIHKGSGGVCKVFNDSKCLKLIV